MGHWEGDTLVVATSNIREDTQVDFSGVPHSEALTITERLRRTAPDTLEDQITLTDPKALAEEHQVREFFAPYGEWAGLAAVHAMGG